MFKFDMSLSQNFAIFYDGDDVVLVEVLFDGEEELVGVDGLDEVVGYLRADGLVHDVLFLALRHHDDGRGGLYVFDLPKCLQSRQSGHHLVEQNQVECLATAGFDGVDTIADRHDFVAFHLQKTDVAFQEFYLVVGPSNQSVVHCQNPSKS